MPLPKVLTEKRTVVVSGGPAPWCYDARVPTGVYERLLERWGREPIDLQMVEDALTELVALRRREDAAAESTAMSGSCPDCGIFATHLRTCPVFVRLEREREAEAQRIARAATDAKGGL